MATITKKINYLIYLISMFCTLPKDEHYGGSQWNKFDRSKNKDKNNHVTIVLFLSPSNMEICMDSKYLCSGPSGDPKKEPQAKRKPKFHIQEVKIQDSRILNI